MVKKLALSDWVSLLSLLVAMSSISFVLYDRFKASKLEKMNLKIDILNYYFSTEDERIFIEFSFINESSKPITISNSSIKSWKEQLPNTTLGFVGGSLIFDQTIINGKTYMQTASNVLHFKTDRQTDVLPFTIKPFNSTILRLGYHLGKSAPFVIPLRENELNIIFSTTRDTIQGVANLKAKTFEYDTYNRKYES